MTDNDSVKIDYENLDDLPFYEHVRWQHKNPKLFNQNLNNKVLNWQKEKTAYSNSLYARLRLNSADSICS